VVSECVAIPIQVRLVGILGLLVAMFLDYILDRVDISATVMCIDHNVSLGGGAVSGFLIAHNFHYHTCSLNCLLLLLFPLQIFSFAL
jgi:hypothetical protein